MGGIKHQAAMAYVSSVGTILSVNAAFGRLLGYQPEELRQQRFWSLLCAQDLEVFREHLTRAAERLEPLLNLRLSFLQQTGQQHSGYLTLLWSFDYRKNSYYGICLVIGTGPPASAQGGSRSEISQQKRLDAFPGPDFGSDARNLIGACNHQLEDHIHQLRDQCVDKALLPELLSLNASVFDGAWFSAGRNKRAIQSSLFVTGTEDTLCASYMSGSTPQSLPGCKRASETTI